MGTEKPCVGSSILPLAPGWLRKGVPIPIGVGEPCSHDRAGFPSHTVTLGKLAPNAENEAPTEEMAIPQWIESIEEENWSRRSGLNRRRADYEPPPDQTSPTDPDESSTKPRNPARRSVALV